MGTMSNTSSLQHGRLLVSKTSTTRSLLGTNLATGSIDLIAPERVRLTETVAVTFVDDGFVENVSAERSIEKLGGIARKLEGLESGELIDGCEDGLL
jgi:hypothetical protein